MSQQAQTDMVTSLQLFTEPPNGEIQHGIATLYCNIWREPPWCEDFWRPREVRQNLVAQLTGTDAVLSVALNHTNHVVGFSWAHRVSVAELCAIGSTEALRTHCPAGVSIAYVDELAVARVFRGRHVGKMLSLLLLQALDRQGDTMVFLRTDKEAIAARALYASIGFRELPVVDGAHPTRTFWRLQL